MRIKLGLFIILTPVKISIRMNILGSLSIEILKLLRWYNMNPDLQAKFPKQNIWVPNGF